MAKEENFTHRLVKTLSSAERSYIKKQVKKNELHFAELLDDLYKTDVCNDRDFKKKFGSKNYVKNLSQNKNYLRFKIIDALVQHQRKHVPEIENRHQLDIIDILVERGFLKKTKQLVDDLLFKCKKYEDFLTAYHLAVKARRILSNNITSSLRTEDIKRYATERRYCLEQLGKVEQLASLNDIHITAMQKDEKIKAITNQLKILNLEMEILPEEYPYTAKRIFYYTKSELAKLKNEKQQRIFFLKKLVQLYKQYPHFIERDYTKYLVDCINYLNSLIKNTDYDSFFKEHFKIMEQLKKLQHTAYVAENSRVYVLQYLFPQNVFSNSGSFEDALKFADTYLTFLKTNEKKLSTQFIEASIIQISIAFLYNQNYEKTLDLIDTHHKSKNYKHQYTFRVIQIICHYYLKNDFLLDHLFNSFIHYLKTNIKKEAIAGIYQFKKHVRLKLLHNMKDDIIEDFTWIKFNFLNELQ